MKFTDWRTTQTTTGIGGDPTLATAAKGELIVTAAVAAMIDVAGDFKDLHFGERADLRALPEASSDAGPLS